MDEQLNEYGLIWCMRRCEVRQSFGVTLAGGVFCLFFVCEWESVKNTKKSREQWEKVDDNIGLQRWQRRGLMRERKYRWRSEGWKMMPSRMSHRGNRQWLLNHVQCLGEGNWWVHLHLIIVMMDRIADFPQRQLNDSLTQIWMTGFTGGVH